MPIQGKQRLAILGSTGSIGRNCLDVVASLRDKFEIIGLTSNTRWELLAEQCHQFHPRVAILPEQPVDLDRKAFPACTKLCFGEDAITDLASDSDVDTIVSAIVGAAGFRGTLAGVKSGKKIALANKESLVVGGPLISQLLPNSGAQLIPVDSEHSAIFQALSAGRNEEVVSLILTASGGPFRSWPREKLEQVTPEQALQHPTWNMGPKITVDSATMMNKALELIEARWLFELPAERLRVVIHPQSIVHSMVEFRDGAVVAQLSPPDMRLPIQYALTYPLRFEGPARKMDWTASTMWEFHPPDLERFPALELGYTVAKQGGTSGAVLNGANEIAVSRFLAKTLRYVDIPRACREILNSHTFDPHPSFEELIRQDRWAREEMKRWN